MNTSDVHTSEHATRDDGVLVLTDLVALWDVRVEVVFTVELGEVGDVGIHSQTYLDHVLDRLGVRNWQGARVSHTDGAGVFIRDALERDIGAGAPHFRLGLHLSVDF